MGLLTTFWHVHLIKYSESHWKCVCVRECMCVCVCVAAAAAAKSPQSCPTLCDPTDSNPPGSPAPGILQARTLEWVAISFSSARKWKVKVKSFSCVWLCNPMDCSLPGSSLHGIFQAWILEWVAISFSRWSSQPRDQTWVPRIVSRCFTVWATRDSRSISLMGKYLN